MARPDRHYGWRVHDRERRHLRDVLHEDGGGHDRGRFGEFGV